MSFDGLHVVVTGGTGALGQAVASRLVAAGAMCHIPSRAQREARDPKIIIHGGVDLTDEGSVEAFYGQVPEVFASIHLAGGFAMSPIAETSKDDFLEQINMNALTCFLCCREAARRMRAAPHSDGGRIVNVAARPALEPRTGAGMTAYAASKAAVATLTQSLAQELAPEHIWVNGVVPSIMDTPANREAMPDADHASWPKVEHVADAIAYLASPENRVTRGALLTVYGNT